MVDGVVLKLNHSLWQRCPTFLAPGTGFMEKNFSTDRGGGGYGRGYGAGGNASDGERWRAADEALFARLPLTSSCVAWFLTSWGWGTPALQNEYGNDCYSQTLLYLTYLYCCLLGDGTNISLLPPFQTTVKSFPECSKVMWHLFGTKA